jgi:multiple sugar transport system permease protein
MRNVRRAEPLLWLAPTLLLIVAVIVYPAYEMVRTSFLDVSSIGFAHGYKGLGNYRDLFAEEALLPVFVNTVLWVVIVVGATIVVSLAMAQFLNKRFAGRRFVRWALIVPWAASLVMTSTVWRYIYELDYGSLNRLLLDLGLIEGPVDWYKDSATAFWCLVFVGIVVSIPFTTYVFLAGLQTVPAEVYEAAAMDGAGPVQTYWRVTFPMLRPQLVVAIVLNTIYVFNSFPIIWVITGKIPGNETDTAITYMYKLAFRSSAGADEAAALGVINVIFLMALVLFYVRRTGFGESSDAANGGPGVAARVGRALIDALAPLGRAVETALTPMGRGLCCR